MLRHRGPAAVRRTRPLDWPEAPHLQLFHAQTLLREHRGDGHIAALALAGSTRVEALVTYLGSRGPAAACRVQMVRATRGWTDEDWDGRGRRGPRARG